MVRTRGTDLDEKVLCGLLDQHAPMKAVNAKTLFHTIGNKWATLKFYREFCSELLDCTCGRMPRQLSFQQSLHVWLTSQGLEWTRNEEDTTTLALRSLLAVLLGKKRKDENVPKEIS